MKGCTIIIAIWTVSQPAMILALMEKVEMFGREGATIVAITRGDALSQVVLRGNRPDDDLGVEHHHAHQSEVH